MITRSELYMHHHFYSQNLPCYSVSHKKVMSHFKVPPSSRAAFCRRMEEICQRPPMYM